MQTVSITSEQLEKAKGLIRAKFPGQSNKELRALLQAQLKRRADEIHGVEKNAYCRPRVKLGYGVFFINGDGDERTQNFNADINKALGLEA